VEVAYEYCVTVRGYELDSFNHVNNAVYLNYLEQARWEVFRESGSLEYLNEHKILPAAIETNIRYVREAKLFNSLRIKTRVTTDEPYLLFKHVIYIEETGKVSCKATNKILFLTLERQPTDIPRYVRERLGC
jgi:acyl-CoA thioester hydrolase